MSETQILDAIKLLSPQQQISIVESTVSLLKNQIETSNGGRKKKTFAELAAEMSAAGEQALADGAPELPSDFAERHDYYLYGIDRK
jgi:hypothetical protein